MFKKCKSVATLLELILSIFIRHFVQQKGYLNFLEMKEYYLL